MTTAAMSAANAQGANIQQRMALLDSNQLQVIPLSPQTGPMGSVIRQNLNNNGVTTGVDIDVVITLTNANTTAETLTPNSLAAGSPYNAVALVEAYDYNNRKRHYLTGYQNFLINSERQGNVRRKAGLYGMPLGSTPNPYVTVPTSIPASGSAQVTFRLHVPFAYCASQDKMLADLRGAIYSQTSIGNLPVVVTLAASTFGTVYSGSLPSGVTESATVKLVQHWINPQPVNGAYPLPQLDLATVYELSGNIVDNSNLVAGQDKFINVPDVREVLTAYFVYQNGTEFNAGTDVNYWKLLVNGNQVMQNYQPKGLAYNDIEILSTPLPPAVYLMRTRRVPVYTALQGNIQYVFNPITVNSGAHLLEAFESFYNLGAVLPGIAG